MTGYFCIARYHNILFIKEQEVMSGIKNVHSMENLADNVTENLIKNPAFNPAGHSIEERLELSVLYDFYGALLKENQRRMFEANVLEDFNYSEIAEDEGITRQGVYDTVKRAGRQLRFYEDKLGLVAKSEEQRGLVKCLREKLERAGLKENCGEWEEIERLLDGLDGE